MQITGELIKKYLKEGKLEDEDVEREIMAAEVTSSGGSLAVMELRDLIEKVKSGMESEESARQMERMA